MARIFTVQLDGTTVQGREGIENHPLLFWRGQRFLQEERATLDSPL